MTTFRRLATLVPLVAWLLAPSPALACPICAPGLSPRSLVQEVAEAERAVVVRPAKGEPARFEVVAVVVGHGSPSEVIVVPAMTADASTSEREATRLLLRDPRTLEWTSPGAIGLEHVPSLRQMAMLSPAPASDVERLERLRFFHVYLEHGEPLLARAAHEEIARAPYGAMKSLKPVLDASRLRAWIDDAPRSSRRALHYLLVGIAGDATDARRIQERIVEARRGHRVEHLAAMLVADLELGGASRVSELERAYLADATRTAGEIQAALLALSVYANAGGQEARARVIRAYRLVIERAHPLAGFVASDLADWEYWDAGPAFLALLASDRLYPAARFAVLGYLRASPRPEAQAGLRAILERR